MLSLSCSLAGVRVHESSQEQGHALMILLLILTDNTPKMILTLEKRATALGEVTISPGSSAKASGNNLWQLWEGHKTSMIFIFKIAGFFHFLSSTDASFLPFILYQLLEVTAIFLTVHQAGNSSLFWEPRNPVVGKQGNIFLPLLYSFSSFIKIFPFILLLVT